MRRASDLTQRPAAVQGVRMRLARGVLFSAGALVCQFPLAAGRPEPAPCSKPVYLTIDTGHMGVAELIAETLDRHGVKATFFLANEVTQAVGERPAGETLDPHWASFWKRLAVQGHDFGSHTWNHLVWRADRPDGAFTMQPTAGPRRGERQRVDAPGYCAELAAPAQRFAAQTGRPMRALFRAPGGKTSPALLRAAAACGWQHVGWSDAGFLGDELPSDRYPNDALLRQALARIRPGNILMMHLGIWSRQDPWAPAVLEPLIVGLQARGMCFVTLRAHPVYGRVGDAPK
jgi:peptidoglycan/xylan/chitin deacetylase (PgdA/CDA1 family)